VLPAARCARGFGEHPGSVPRRQVLEHERVLVFGAGDGEEFFLTSADWMPRNLDRRVELLFPVESVALRERLRREVIEPLEGDNCRVYEMGPDGRYTRRQPPSGDGPVDAQELARQAGSLTGGSF
jgi:polyphosphate kinase